MSDIKKWAETISSLLKPGGIFYIFEFHPFIPMFDDTVSGDLKIKFPYFHQSEPIHWTDDQPDYADASYVPKNKTCEWSWTISDIVNALIGNELTIELFNEHDVTFSPSLPDVTYGKDGWWRLEKYGNNLPLSFSIRARKQ